VAFNVCNSTLEITKHLKIWRLFLATQTWRTFNIIDTRLAVNCKWTSVLCISVTWNLKVF